jgi:hypothetical protein
MRLRPPNFFVPSRPVRICSVNPRRISAWKAGGWSQSGNNDERRFGQFSLRFTF